MINYDNIPDELKLYPNWVGATKGNKIPIQIWDNTAASSTDPTTWVDFYEALDAYEREKVDYLGYVFTDNGYVGIDIDVGYENNLITPLAYDIITKCKSYTEKSRSGRGFHIILKGDLPFKGRNNLNGVEIYKSARYFIMTGDIKFYEPKIVENQQAIDYILEKYFELSDRQIDKRSNKTYDPFKKTIYQPIYTAPIGLVPIKPFFPEIPNGARNISLTSYAGQLYQQGYEYDELLDEVMKVNDIACSPPLKDREVKMIVNSIFRYDREVDYE